MDTETAGAVERYLDAATKLLAMPLDPQRRSAVGTQLTRIAGFAAALVAFELDDSIEIAGDFRP